MLPRRALLSENEMELCDLYDDTNPANFRPPPTRVLRAPVIVESFTQLRGHELLTVDAKQGAEVLRALGVIAPTANPIGPTVLPNTGDAQSQTVDILPLDDPLFMPPANDAFVRTELAVTYLRDSRWPNSERYFHRTTPSAMSARRVTESLAWRVATGVALGVLLGLVYIEAPTFASQRYDWRFTTSCMGQFLSAGVLAAHLVLSCSNAGTDVVFRRHHNKTIALIVALIMAEALLALATGPAFAWRATRVLRPVLVLLFWRPLRGIFHILFLAFSQLQMIGTFALLFVWMFALAGWHMFKGLYHSELDHGGAFVYEAENFNTLGRAAQVLVWVLTRKSSVSVIWPAVAEHGIGAPYFVAVGTLGNYFMFPIIVAVMTKAAQAARKARAKADMVYERRVQLAAFQLLDLHRDGCIDSNTARALLERVEPRLRHAEFSQVLDNVWPADGAPLTPIRWLNCCDAIRYRVTDARPFASLPFMQALGGFVCSSPLLTAILDDRVRFDGLMTRIALVGLAALSLDPPGSSDALATWAAAVYLVCLALACTLFAVRITRLSSLVMTRLNAAEAWLLVALVVLELAESSGLLRVLGLLDYHSVFRVAFGALVVLHVAAFRRLVQLCYRSLVAASFSLFCVSALVFYMFSVVGMEIWGLRLQEHRVKNVNPSINWDSFTSANMLLFQLVNFANWPQIQVFAERAAGTVVTVLYFAAFDVVIVVITLSLLTSLFMEAYNAYNARLEKALAGTETDAADLITSAAVHARSVVSTDAGATVQVQAPTAWAREAANVPAQEVLIEAGFTTPAPAPALV